MRILLILGRTIAIRSNSNYTHGKKDCFLGASRIRLKLNVLELDDVVDILLYAIYPTKRSIALAINILCRFMGDAGSLHVVHSLRP